MATGNIDEQQRMVQLRERLFGVDRLPGELDFFDNPETLKRFLKARDWDVDEAEKILCGAVEWRRKNDPLHMECRWCNDEPGYHSIRQVGFDLIGRPVIYACFTQTANNPTVDDTIAHCTYLIENAKRTMADGVSAWVFVMDCRGMSLQACNPRIGYGTTQVFANFYPERLGLVICVHHNPIFHGVWNAIKVFLHENTVAKMHLIRPKKKIVEEFRRQFDEELQQWLFDEMKENKWKPIPPSQKYFWKAPENPGDHDPRGCPSYVAKYVEPFLENVKKFPEETHRPHPNIVGELQGTIKPVVSLKRASSKSSKNNNHVDGKASAAAAASGAAAARGGSLEDDSASDSEKFSNHDVNLAELSEEFQIPKNAVPFQSS